MKKSMLLFACLCQVPVPCAARSAEAVTLSADKAVYSSQVRLTADRGYGESIRIRVVNGGSRDIFFHADTIIPFTSLYLEMFRDKKWSFQGRSYGMAKFPPHYSSEDWLKAATRLKPGEKFDFLYKIEYPKGADPYKAGKYRFKLDYCFALPGPDDWLDRAEVGGNVIGGNVKGKSFETAYSAPFRLK